MISDREELRVFEVSQKLVRSVARLEARRREREATRRASLGNGRKPPRVRQGRSCK